MPKVPVKKVAKKAAPAAAAKKAVAAKAPARKTARKTAPESPAAAPQMAPAVKKAPARKVARKAAAKPAPAVTRVIAKIDAGFGNGVHIRGSGCGLVWDTGVLMENKGSDEWIWESTAATSELEFKVLLNDEVWSAGPNGVIFPGATVVFEPVF
jgi:hypothetical protein